VPETAIAQHVFPNGLTLLAERMPAVQSAALTFLIPAGAVYDPPEQLGTAAMLAEWISRGAGPRDGRELLTALDNLGVNHAESAQAIHTSLAAATLGRNLLPALEIFADMVRRPRLDDAEIEPIRALAVQGLRSLEDDPGSKVITELRRRHFPEPWGRPASGTIAGVEAAEAEAIRHFHAACYRPNGAILAVAGAIDWPALRDAVERLFGDWAPRPDPPLASRTAGPRRDHILKDTQQIQIAMAVPSATVADLDYYPARAAAAILGGYSSARLFTEVREKRGLCYSVYAGYESFRERAALLCHAGTSAERADQTQEVMLAELRRLAGGGVDAEELDTMRAGLKSSLIMQQESSMSRAAALASDWYYLGRVRSLDEIAAALDALTAESVSRYCATLPLDELTVLTLGPKALTAPRLPG
jgi:predicted Zn-dependent peptidase